jgi:hypothetical protein
MRRGIAAAAAPSRRNRQNFEMELAGGRSPAIFVCVTLLGVTMEHWLLMIFAALLLAGLEEVFIEGLFGREWFLALGKRQKQMEIR